MKSKLLLAVALVAALPLFAKTIDEIVVKVNDSIITKNEYEKRLSQTTEGFKREYKGPDFEQKLKELPQRLLQQMTEELLLIEKAKQLYQVDVIVNAQMENFMQENGIKNEADLDKALKNEGMSLDEFKRQILLIYVPEFMKSREVRSKISLTTAEIDDFTRRTGKGSRGSRRCTWRRSSFRRRGTRRSRQAGVFRPADRNGAGQELRGPGEALFRRLLEVPRRRRRLVPGRRAL